MARWRCTRSCKREMFTSLSASILDVGEYVALPGAQGRGQNRDDDDHHGQRPDPVSLPEKQVPQTSLHATVAFAGDPAPTGSKAEPPRTVPRIVSALDVQDMHLQAVLDQVVDTGLAVEEGFELVKFYASASKTQQHYDVSIIYRVIKQSLARAPGGSCPALHAENERALHKVLSTSCATFTTFLDRLPFIISKACTKGNLRGGWRSSDCGRPIPSRCGSTRQPGSSGSAMKLAARWKGPSSMLFIKARSPRTLLPSLQLRWKLRCVVALRYLKLDLHHHHCRPCRQASAIGPELKTHQQSTGCVVRVTALSPKKGLIRK